MSACLAFCGVRGARGGEPFEPGIRLHVRPVFRRVAVRPPLECGWCDLVRAAGPLGVRRRAGLDQALAAVWPGSILTVTKFDRFARDVADAHAILTGLSNRGVLFGLGASVYDWKDPFGRLFLQTLAIVAEFEANLNHLRTREGMARARRQGKLRGKQPTLPPAAGRTIRRRCAAGEVSLADLAEEYSVGRSTIHRPEPAAAGHDR